MEGVTALARGLAKCSGLEHLDLQDNTFTEDGSTTAMRVWEKLMPSWPELKTLNLSDCVLSAEGEVPSIVKALVNGSNPKLQTLELQNNNLEGNTVALLADAISSHLRNLVTLGLQWNDVDEGEEMLETLSDVLKMRGGKLLISDEDEQEKEDSEEPETPLKGLADTDRDADDLADVLSKTGIH
jgi:Ran GTPase-activating protein 1